MNKLPEFQRCKSAVFNRTATELEKFIFMNEPQDIENEISFRWGLCAVINEQRTKVVQYNYAISSRVREKLNAATKGNQDEDNH